MSFSMTNWLVIERRYYLFWLRGLVVCCVVHVRVMILCVVESVVAGIFYDYPKYSFDEHNQVRFAYAAR